MLVTSFLTFPPAAEKALREKMVVLLLVMHLSKMSWRKVVQSPPRLERSVEPSAKGTSTH